MNAARAGTATSAAWISTNASTRSSARRRRAASSSQSRRQSVSDHEALDVVGHVKRHPEKARVLAHGSNPRHPDAQWPEGQLQTGLAHDVVSRRRQWRPRRPAQNVPVAASLEQEREVRTSALTNPGGDDRPRPEAVVVEEVGYALQDEQRRMRQGGRLVLCPDDVRFPGSRHRLTRAGATRAGATRAGATRAGATRAGATRAGATWAGASRAGASRAGASRAGASRAGGLSHYADVQRPPFANSLNMRRLTTMRWTSSGPS